MVQQSGGVGPSIVIWHAMRRAGIRIPLTGAQSGWGRRGCLDEKNQNAPELKITTIKPHTTEYEWHSKSYNDS